ncbi:MAG: S41 family peptidase [Bacteroidota bacterium]
MRLTRLRRTHWLIAAAFVLIASLTAVSFKREDDSYFEIARNLDIFTTVMRELTVYYVDPIEPQPLVEEGIASMLESLDPYTQFIPEEEADDYRFMTTGQYGGIGALIGQRNEQVIITDPYEGFPAQKGGLVAGDALLSIDGKSLKGLQYDEVSRLLKGQPGTSVELQINREGESKPLRKTLVREEITIRNVPYYSLMEDSIGYIRLGGFTDNAAREVREAVTDLVQKRKAKGLIIDLRGNPGGLLDEAVGIVNVFVDKGQEVVSTRGRVKEWDKTYRTTAQATDTRTPLAILVSSGSASASEIVSGALQDLDRAVVIGQRTFGKGLVQTTRPLNYNAQLKITTAKYYIPSGRCIQALDYSHRNPDGSVGKVPDSLTKVFKTRSGRTVRDGGGILPDQVTELPQLSSIAQALVTNYVIFDYATRYRLDHPSIAPAGKFRLDDAGYEAFISWQHQKNFSYQSESDKRLLQLRETAEKEGYFSHIRDEYEAVRKRLAHDRDTDLRLNKEEICLMLENEIVSRYYYQNGRIETTFDDDPDLLLARKALRSPAVYSAILERRYTP